MFFTVTLCLVTYLIQLCNTYSMEEQSQYECGAHGKFEYCINGLAGCVIGCHCHPGFYFDTDTKICESNSKLTRDIRRRFNMAKPTRAYPINTPTMFENNPTPNPLNVFDPWNEENDKANDNLGDWLYSQFFKTIETQVINNTNEKPTRRSGNFKPRISDEVKRGSGRRTNDDHHIGSIKRKANRLWKGKGKKKKTKVHGLRRKLLRITEDDSLFDSDENSSESNDSSGSDDDDSDSGSSSRDGSKEEKDKTKKDKDSKDDRQHGHKKVIIFNRRPRPPLPSFIFLPSMDTPFYPPIGLPPPPILPMYPMVPVPPMAPYFPFTGNNNDSSSSTTTPASQTSSDHSADVKTETTTAAPTGAPDATTTPAALDTPESTPVPGEPDPESLRSRSKLRNGQAAVRSSEETFMVRSRDAKPRKPLTSKQMERFRLMQKFRERLKKKKKQPTSVQNTVDDHESGVILDVVPDIDDTSLYVPVKSTKRKQNQKEKENSASDVNFKYISELIHRLNQTKDKPQSFDMKDDLKQFQKIQSARRSYNPQNEAVECQNEIATHKSSDSRQVEDAYFTNLGRKIACMVRSDSAKVDCNEITDHKKLHKDLHSLINQYSYSPRTFWERSVRSPLTRLKSYINKLDKHSSEMNLLSLENEVSYIASTTPPLSLQDLENILSTLHKFQGDTTNRNTSNRTSTSFNVDLLQNKPLQPEIYSRRFGNPLDNSVYTPQIKIVRNSTNTKQSPSNSNIVHYLDPTNIDFPMINDWMFNYEENKKSKKKMSKQLSAFNKSLEYDTSYVKPRAIYKNINKQVEYLKLINFFPRLALKNGQLHSKYPEFGTNFHDKPIKYSEAAKYPDQLENYVQLPAKQSEIPANYRELPNKYSELLTKYPEMLPKNPDMLAKYPDLPEKYPDMLAKFPDMLGKNPNMLTRYPDMPEKYPDMLAKYPDILGKNPDMLAKYPDMVEKYPETIAQYPDMLGKNPEMPAKYPDMLEKNLDIVAKYPDLLEKYPDLLEKYPDMLAKYPDILEKYPDILAKYPDILAKYPDILAKSPDIFAKYPQITGKYPEIFEPNFPENYHEILVKYPDMPAIQPNKPAKYPELSNTFADIPIKYPVLIANFANLNKKARIYHNSKFPSMSNYKKLNYFSDSDNNHHRYMFEGYPLTKPHKKDFAQRFESYSSKPSYFQHELHHFDYFE